MFLKILGTIPHDGIGLFNYYNGVNKQDSQRQCRRKISSTEGHLRRRFIGSTSHYKVVKLTRKESEDAIETLRSSNGGSQVRR